VPATLDHLLLEPAQVFILAGQESRYDREPWDYRTTDAWCLWSIVDGTVDLKDASGRCRRLSAPVLLCLQPGGAETLSVPVGTSTQRLVLALRWVPRQILGTAAARPCSTLGERQPEARAWFGQDLPTVVDPPFRTTGMRVVEHACRDWWRGDLRRLRASAEVAAWLYDWVLSREVGGTDIWSRLEGLVRERLAQGISVASLAVASGISRTSLLRHLRAAGRGTPSDWIDALREEEARRLLDARSPVRDVARFCGFRSPAAFARWFRRRCGLPPSQVTRSRLR